MIQEETFNRMLDGKQVGFFTIRGGDGMYAQITNYGARIVGMTVPVLQGGQRDVVLGFPTLDEWLTQEVYLNAVIGRYANRIKDGRFELDGRTYQLPLNDDGRNCLHGGTRGFHTQVWEVVRHTPDSLLLHYHAKDGEEGFPGNAEVEVRYTITRGNALEIAYSATTDAPTPFGMTHHAYFNLEGEASGSVREHLLQIMANQYTPLDDTFCPTGEIKDVSGTAMDFRKPVRLGDRMDDPFFAHGKGIDNNWVLSLQPHKAPTLVARLTAKGCAMEVWTTMPGLQVYTSNYVAANRGKSGTYYAPQCAVCLEAQSFPDSPNHPHFPSVILRPGEEYRHVTRYVFRLV